MMRPKPARFPQTLKNLRHSGNFALQTIPKIIAINAIEILMMSFVQLSETDAPYVPFTYRYKLSGINTTEARVDTVVIATLRARSALNKEHHQLLNAPPGENVVANRGMPYTGSKSKALAEQKP